MKVIFIRAKQKVKKKVSNKKVLRNLLSKNKRKKKIYCPLIAIKLN